MRIGVEQAKGRPAKNFFTPNVTHAVVKVGKAHARHDGEAMTPGMLSTLWTTCGEKQLIRVTLDRHHAVAQRPLDGLGGKALQRIFHEVP